jgi:hypothetical protein
MSQQTVPECLIPIEEHVYRCSKFGWIIRSNHYPIHCTCPTNAEEILLSQEEAKRKTSSEDHQPDVPKGPGDYLHELIVYWTGEQPEAGCQCRQRIETMNSWGPQGCREHIDEIVGWLQAEAIERGWKSAKWPGAQFAIKRLVLTAIKKAEKDKI